MNGPRLHDQPIEQRLREALQARAHTVDLDDLRPAAPPVGPARTRLPTRRTVAMLFGMAAAVAAMLFALPDRHSPPQPVPARVPPFSGSTHPANPAASPSPVPSPTGPTARGPSATATQPVEPSTAAPHAAQDTSSPPAFPAATDRR